ncbi:MAG: helix-turn-helix domain-containing protein, partial [Dehalococcoidia bacterium]
MPGPNADAPRRIKGLRAAYGLTQAQLASLLGVSFASVNRWENGQRQPSPAIWRLILRAESEGFNLPASSAGPSAAALAYFIATPSVTNARTTNLPADLSRFIG